MGYLYLFVFYIRLTSILPVRVSPEIWLGPSSHLDLNSPGNDPSVQTLPGPSASKVTTLWRYANLFIITIIIIFPQVV